MTAAAPRAVVVNHACTHAHHHHAFWTERGVIIEAIQEMGEVVGVPTPTIDVVVPLLKEVEATSLRGGEVAGGNIR